MKKVVKSLIFNEKNQILLIKRAHEDSHAGYWETPCGGVDGDETLLSASIREVKEETGLTIDHSFFSNDLDLTDDETSEIYNVSLFVTMLDDTPTVDISKNPDHQAFIWMDVNDLHVLEIDSWTKKQINVYFNDSIF